MPALGEKKKGRDLGYKSHDSFVFDACPSCGGTRWVQQSKTGRLCRHCGMLSDRKKELIPQIIYLYREEKESQSRIAKKIGLSQAKISYHLYRLGVEKRSIKEQARIDVQKGKWKDKRKYKVNDNFFERLNKNSAYVFGFCYADGTWKNRNSLTIGSINREHLEKIAFVMSTNAKAGFRSKENIYLLKVTSPKITRDLSNLSLNLEKVVKGRFFIPFLRGYFDGDGSIYLNRTNLVIGFCSKDIFPLELIRDKLSTLGIKGSLRSRNMGSRILHNLRYNGKYAEGLATLFYGDSKPFLCLDRKYSKWELYQVMKNQKSACQLPLL